MRRLIIAALLLVVACAGCSADSGKPSASATTLSPASATRPAPDATPATAAPVVREVLVEMADPPGAPGRTLTLIRYTIAPGARLDAHIHPGVQLASIESGTLTYTVESGTARVRRKGGTTEDLAGPTVTELGPGDAVEETGAMVHFGANDTNLPIVILATLLTETGKGLAVVVDGPTATTPP